MAKGVRRILLAWTAGYLNSLSQLPNNSFILDQITFKERFKTIIQLRLSNDSHPTIRQNPRKKKTVVS